MGICSSCESTSVATAKLILQDGRLQEFSYPVKVSYVLQKDPACFICNSDEMEFDDVVKAICEDEELQPGQIYFALPLSRLRRPLQAEEMAALAVKASAALTKSGRHRFCCRTKGVAPVLFGGDKEVRSSRKVAVDGGEGNEEGGGRRKRFGGNLSTILE
ncbi:hypothetical protein Ancab_003720 [Ancistrocladus abbreviatus]